MQLKTIILFLIFLSGACLSSKGQARVAGPDYLLAIKKELNAVWPHNRTINLVFQGHSVPAGYGDRHEVHTFDAYPYQVLGELKRRYPYAVINVIVTAIGGENSISGAERFKEEVLSHRPDVLFIDYALNDRGAGLEKAREAWEEMIQAALQKGTKVILLTPSPDQRVDILAPDNDLKNHAEQIRRLAARYHTGLADPFARFTEIAREEDGIKGYMASVNHPNRKGHEIIATEILQWFAEAP